ncbi:penicillin-binding protein 2 [Nocardioides aromaticivorans]|uniref:Penicillin-binding protein 2 n=1 Tax=Nocardioides aromaticivorans TaxID=200618 RepID=A0ABX7PP87_9ACTN|nr:penicillin-binding protein 2 [Nocardioides aromaticivorans]QSR27532.1 penicillin-binding protein 2 [Nocardioides aromaticivorans]
MTAASHRSRLRLIVIQTLVFSLLATLGARLYYLQVISGEEYQGQAASQSVREIVVQPQRGLIVDAMGRPLVTNRLTWVVSMDRTLVGRMSEADRTELLARTARAIGVKVPRIRAKLLLCGDEGSVAGECWNGSPYQPVPIAQDVKETAALRILEQPEDFPGVVVDRQSVRQYPSPYGINAAHLLGYLSPITKEELEDAEDDGDSSVNGASVVGRAGVEKEYDEFLRGQPGYQQVAVDSKGRVRQDVSDLAAQPGDTLVTSIDANVQSVVEEQLAKMIQTQRNTLDPVTDRKFEADSGAAVVLEARTGRIVAMASQPTYDPSVWVGGITDKQLARLYSEAAGTPLLSRAFQGQFAPGSTWKPFMTVGALTHGYSPDTILPCSSAVQIGNRAFHNHESSAYGPITFARALEVSCNTFFFQVGMHFWQTLGSDPDDVNAKDPLVSQAEKFGFGERTGVDLPGEASGRVADRKWKKAYYESMKNYYCGIADKPQDAKTSDFVYKFAREFCIEGWKYKITDSANFAIGQGDTIVTPLQLARAYAALSNGGTLWEPRVGKAVVSPDGKVIREIAPKKERQLKIPKKVLRYLDEALQGVASRGTMAWKLGGFPLDKVTIRAKTGSAEVYGKQSTGWVASYTKDYVVVMMISQAGTGSGATGEGVRAIWEALYGVDGDQVREGRAAIPGVTQPATLPTFGDDGSILPPARKEQ